MVGDLRRAATSPLSAHLVAAGFTVIAVHGVTLARFRLGQPGDRLIVSGGYQAARAAQRSSAPSELVHAVPAWDTTRTAACGARVRRTPGVRWDPRGPTACPDCAQTAP